MLIESRKHLAFGGDYAFGFNGKMVDKEVKGEGNQQDYGMRIYDPRIARFLSIDPLADKFAFYSPFHFAGNKPIVAVDLDGQEDVWIHEQTFLDGSKNITTIYKGDDNYESMKEGLAAALGIPIGAIPETGSLSTSSKTGDDNTQTNFQFSYNRTAEITEYKDNFIVRALKSLDVKQGNAGEELVGQGEEGLENYLKGVESVSKLLKYTGKHIPVIGKEVEAFGEGVGIAKTFMEFAGDIDRGKYKVLASRAILEVATNMISKSLDYLPTKGAIKTAKDVAVDESLDYGKEKVIDEAKRVDH